MRPEESSRNNSRKKKKINQSKCSSTKHAKWFGNKPQMPSKCQFKRKPFHSYFWLIIIIIISVQCLLYSPVASFILFETRYYFKRMRLKCTLDSPGKDEIIYLNHSCPSRGKLSCEPDLFFLQQNVLSDREPWVENHQTQTAKHRNKFPIQMIHLALRFDWIENAGRIAKHRDDLMKLPNPMRSWSHIKNK